MTILPLFSYILFPSAKIQSSGSWVIGLKSRTTSI